MLETQIVNSHSGRDEAEIPEVDQAASEHHNAVNIKLGLSVNEESSSRFPNYDVVAVHGLNGDSQRTWGSSSGGSTWLKDKLFEYNNTRFMSYDYDTDEATGSIYRRKGMIEEASKLLISLLELRKPVEQGELGDIADDTSENSGGSERIRGPSGSNPHRPLVFIAHDLGGIVVKQALILAGLDPFRFGSITSSTAAMIFFGCPHRCQDFKDMEESITRLLFYNGKPNGNVAMRVVKGLSKTIIEINGAFIDTKMLIRPNITNVYSTLGDPVEQVFDKLTATMNIPFENRVSSVRAHGQIVTESNFYNRSIGNLLGHIPYPLGLPTNIAQYLPIFLSQASPIYPLRTANDPQCPDSEVIWIDADEAFLKWRAGKDSSILHVYGTSRISKASEYIFHSLDSMVDPESENSVLYFEFQKHDARFNSIKSMLSTFLAYIVSHYTDTDARVARNFERLSLYHSWTERDLYEFWLGLRSTMRIDGITYVISGIDYCDESKDWFLTELVSIAKCSENRCRIVITSKGRQDALSEFPAIDIDEHIKDDAPARIKALNGIVGFELLQLLQKRPQYCLFESRIREVLSEGGEDFKLRRLIIDWLNFTTEPRTKLATKSNIEKLSPVTLTNIVTTIMESITPEKRALARKIILWTSCSMRTLSVWELQTALALDQHLEGPEFEDVVLPDVASEVRRCFGTMFQFGDNEIRFGHPDLHEFLVAAATSTTDAWYNFKSKPLAHGEIASSCLQYLSQPEVQKRSAEFSEQNNASQQSPIFDSRLDLLSYATRFWPTHYTLAGGSESPNLAEQVKKFLQNTDTRVTWAKAYHIMSNPINRHEQALSSSLAILGSLGFEDLVNQNLETRDQHEDSFNDDCSLALIEAARNGHRGVVKLLLKSFKPSQATLREATTVAHGSSLTDLLESESALGETYESIAEPWLICKAAWLGLDDVVKALIKVGAEANPSEPMHGMSPLHLAARNNHSGVVRVLLAADGSVTSRAKFGSTPLTMACIGGYGDIVQQILDAKPDIESRDSGKCTALQYACMHGHYQIVNLLLGAGANKDDGEDGEQPLMKAAEYGYTECCRALLAHGAKAEPTKEGKPTPLWHAANGGNLEICRMLLDKGANPNRKFDFNPIILNLAVESGNLELVELLLDHRADIEMIDNSTYSKPTALSRAAEKGSKEIVSCLIQRHANVNLSGAPESTPIYVAARDGNNDIVRMLAEAKADVNIATHGNWCPLHICYDYPDTTRVLLELGADINRVSEDGTPLYLACRWNFPEVVKVYLEYKPDLEIELKKDGMYDGMTALCVATDQGHAEIVRLLLEAGANVNHRPRRQNFPLQMAFNPSVFDFDYPEDTLRAILEYNPLMDIFDEDGDTALNCLTSKTPVSFVRLLINAGANPEIRNNSGNTPLCTAVLENNFEVVKYLLSKNARVDIVSAVRGGPLHIACTWESFEYVKVLVENSTSVDVDLADPGMAGTPLQCACYRNSGDDLDDMNRSIITYMIEEAKANINAYGGLLGYAINAACLKGTPETIQYLLDKGADPNVEDGMGRKPIHLASFRTLDHFTLIPDGDKQLFAEDKLKRTPLHYAVVSGQIDLVKHILDRSKELDDSQEAVNRPDCDGWTPLLWAARTCGKWGTTIREQPDIIELLLSRGADLWVMGDGLDREWSPLKVARYYDAGDEVIKLLTPKSHERVKNGAEWEDRLHTSKKAARRDGSFCDACLFELTGVFFMCQTCRDYGLCFKCYQSRDTVHPSHIFEENGPEYEESPESSPERRVSLAYDDGATILESADEEDTDDESHEEEEVTGEVKLDDPRKGVKPDEDDDEDEEEEDDEEE